MAAVLGEVFDLRIYHFLPACFGLEDLHKRQLKIARIDALNDPFELIGHSAADASTRRLSLRLRWTWLGRSACSVSAEAGTIRSSGVTTLTSTEAYA